VFAGFLVDMLWRGTKDAYGRYGLVDALAELDRRLDRGRPESALVPMDKDAAVNVIRGGVAWARRWRQPLPPDLDIWLRLVDPAPAWGLDLGVFGDGGERPIIVGTEDELARYGRLIPPEAEIVDLDVDEDEEDDEEEDEEAPVEPAALRPGGLWMPGDDLWPAPDEEPPEPEVRGPGGLWLPGR